MKSKKYLLIGLFLCLLPLFFALSSANSYILQFPSTPSGTLTDSNLGGLNISVSSPITLTAVSVYDANLISNITLISSNGNFLASSHVSNGVATFSYSLTTGSYSLLTMDSVGGESYYGWGETPAFPSNNSLNVTYICDYHYNEPVPYGCNGGGNGRTPIYEINYTSALADTIYPTFQNYSSNNATLFGLGTAQLGVKVLNTNGSVYLFFNNTNYTATNSSYEYYNVSIPNLNTGNYTYYWYSYGNGTSSNYNNSNNVPGEEYTDLPDNSYPYFEGISISPLNGTQVSNASILESLCTYNDNGTVWFTINNTNYTASLYISNYEGCDYNMMAGNYYRITSPIYLVSGNYTYFFSAYGNGGNNNYNNSVGLLSQEYSVLYPDAIFPTFLNNSNNNGTIGLSYFNVTIPFSNESGYINISGMVYPMTYTLSNGKQYNVTINLTSGNYSYYYFAYGTGDVHNYNESSVYYFTSNQYQNTSVSIGSVPYLFRLDFNTPEGITEFLFAILIAVACFVFVNRPLGSFLFIADGFIWMMNNQNLLIGFSIIVIGLISIFMPE